MTILSFTDQLSGIRRLGAACGVVVVLALGIVADGSLADRLALIALGAVGFATAAGWLELLSEGRPRQSAAIRVKNRRSRAWLLAAIAVTVGAGLAVQTWFQPGTTIAGGDTGIPDGMAWIGRLFEPWIWTGASLGEPSQLPLALPWAAILSLVHAFGGDPGLARRIWDTTLFVGAGLGALGLLGSLRVGVVAALVGTAAYLFNAYVVSWVNTSETYLAGLCVLTAVPAALIAAGTGQLSVRWSATLVAAASPLLGYAFLNPPQVGMILAAMLAAPFLVAWLDGTEAGFRSLRALLLALPLLLATSAYWIVPAILHLSGAIPNQLADLSGWTWTETRTTIRNALWLNTSWAWYFPEYFPYARQYDLTPLSVARFVPAAMAFGALGLAPFPYNKPQRFRRDRQLRLAVAASTVAVIVIVLSTGTNPPGNIVFDPLYRLPFGWLLREPARFVMLVALAYAVLTAITVEVLLDHQSIRDLIKSRSLTMPRLHLTVPRLHLTVPRLHLTVPRLNLTVPRLHLTVPTLRLSVVPLALGTSLLVGFPLLTGAIVPDTKPTLPEYFVHARPAHVQMPAYWREMAAFTDALPVQGAVLVMPPDDFYEMPYTWYYGSDNFVAELFARRVLLPTAQGYTPASTELIATVRLTSQSILRRDWRQTETLVTVLNAPLILVRRDVVTPYLGRSIVPPNDLAQALALAPNFVLVRQIGSLDLFALTNPVAQTEIGADFMTINSQMPDLRLLALLPPSTALVSGPPRAHVSNVVPAPQLEQWQAQGDTLIWRPPAPPGWAYRIAELDSKTVVPLGRAATFPIANSKARVVYVPNAAVDAVTVQVPGRTAISNGDFTQGLWRPVYDCRALAPTQSEPYLGASVLLNRAPGGGPALRLSASVDSACEYQSLAWRGGSLVMSVMVDHLQGSPPRICLWETGPERCASLPAIPEKSGWSTFRASASPDPGTTALTLYLYADAYQAGERTISEYADVRVVEVSALPTFVLLAGSESQSSVSAQLVVVHSSFSTAWQGSISGEHVLVDGMLNGWLIPLGAHTFSARYEPANAFRAAIWISLVALIVSPLLPAWSWIARLAGRRLGNSGLERQSDE